MAEKMILVVDDEKSIRDAVTFYMKREGFGVIPAKDGAEALEIFESSHVDLVILDIMMQGYGGFEVCSAIRDKNSTLPIIMLSAKSDLVDKSLGFKLGADDYITKPFAIEELLARIRAALRGKGGLAAQSLPLAVGPLVMDVEKHQVTVRGRNVELTKKEFDLLRHLLENKDRVLTREALLDAVWGFDFVGETNSVDVYIRFLRSKLDDAFGLKLIHTVRGVGYVIKED